MVSDIEFLETVCERMQQVGLVQSKADFSTRMLGKGPSYLTSMSARDRNVPDEVMAFLTEQLQHGVAADDVALAELHEEVSRREHQRKHRANMLEWMSRHLHEHGSYNEEAALKGQQRPSITARFLSIFRICRFGNHGTATSL